MSSHLSSHGLAIGARLPMPDSIHGNDDPLMAAFNPMGDSPEPSPHEPTESSYIDPATLPEGWTPCEMSGGSLGPTLVYASPEGWRATTHGPTVPWVTEIVEPWRIVRTLEPAEDLPVIACEDMKPGMMVASAAWRRGRPLATQVRVGRSARVPPRVGPRHAREGG